MIRLVVRAGLITALASVLVPAAAHAQGCFITQSIPTTGVAAPVGYQRATLNGLINTGGDPSCFVGARWEWGETTAYGLSEYQNWPIVAANGNRGEDTPQSVDISNLHCNRAYHFRLQSFNTGTTIDTLHADGDDAIFTTLPCPPTGGTEPVGDVGSDFAILAGIANTGGAPAEAYFTEVFFDIGETMAYGDSYQLSAIAAPVNALSNQGSNVDVELLVNTLECETTYHYRIRVENLAGVATGGDQVFSTSNCAPIESSGLVVYWAEAQAVKLVHPDGSDGSSLLDGRTLNDFDIDPFRRRIVWSETVGETTTVLRSKLDGSDVTPIWETDELPFAIAVDRADGTIYFSERDAGRIERMNADGSGREPLVTQPGSVVFDIELGPDDRIYWYDFATSQMYRADEDGSDVEPLFTAASTLGRFAIDLDGERLYWFELAGLKSAALDGTGVRTDIPGLVGAVLDIAEGTAFYTIRDAGTDQLEWVALDGSDDDFLQVVTPASEVVILEAPTPIFRDDFETGLGRWSQVVPAPR